MHDWLAQVLTGSLVATEEVHFSLRLIAEGLQNWPRNLHHRQSKTNRRKLDGRARHPPIQVEKEALVDSRLLCLHLAVLPVRRPCLLSLLCTFEGFSCPQPARHRVALLAVHALYRSRSCPGLPSATGLLEFCFFFIHGVTRDVFSSYCY